MVGWFDERRGGGIDRIRLTLNDRRHGSWGGGAVALWPSKHIRVLYQKLRTLSSKKIKIESGE